ncbi:TonB-dependent receptor [candidate division KSB1 bacterium]|nr:TonB-dependent receptor [candidate division KSB1 bacterium]
MKKKMVLILLVVVVAAASGFAAEYGRISGQVAEVETGDHLPGANVMIVGSNLGAATDLQGKYVIPRVPAGTYTLQVSYLGYETTGREVTVQINRTVAVDFEMLPTVIRGEQVVVWGARAKGQAMALTQQKNAANIKNIVASDQMGRFPDASAPDAVQRIPGISVQRDMGEGRYIQIRGGSPQMTSVTFNGERVPSPEGDERQIALDMVPVDILEAIEVSKAITPDMDADAIGGSVNLVTKKAPDSRLLTVEAAGGYAPIREKYSPSGSITYGNRFVDGKIGLLLSGSAMRRDFGADDLEPEYNLNGPGLADDQLDELQVRHYSLWRSRIGATAALDYKFSENSRFYVSGIFSEMQDEEQRLRLRHRISKGDYQEDGSVTDATMVLQHKSRHEELTTYNGTLGGEHLLASGLNIDYHLTVTRSEEETPFDNEIEFVQKKISYRPDISDPDNIQSNPIGDPYTGQFKFDNIQPASSLTRDDDGVGALNLRMPYQLGSQTTGYLKFGVKYRNKKKTQDVFESVYELTDDVDDILLDSSIGSAFDNSGYAPGTYPFPPFVTSQEDVDGFVEKYRGVLDKEINAEADVEDFTIKEKTWAAYLLSEIHVSPLLMILPGVRMERTDLDAVGYTFDTDEEVIRESTGSTAYTKFFPMIHTRYRLTLQTNLRAAFTSAMARPNFYDLAPYRIRDDEDLALGNPDLLPAMSTNYDLMIEHYDRTIGVLSLGAFYKNIQDPIFAFSSRNELGGTTEQPRNGESGSIKGLEIAFQRQLTCLPGFLNGLGIYGNYTYTESEATLPGGRKAQFAGQPESVYNIAVSYEKRGFSGQLSMNYHDEFIAEFGSDSQDTPDSDIWIDKHFQVDFSASYRMASNLTVFVELVNLFNEPLRSFIGNTNRPIQMEYYKPWGRSGLRYSF